MRTGWRPSFNISCKPRIILLTFLFPFSALKALPRHIWTNINLEWHTIEMWNRHVPSLRKNEECVDIKKLTTPSSMEFNTSLFFTWSKRSHVFLFIGLLSLNNLSKSGVVAWSTRSTTTASATAAPGGVSGLQLVQIYPALIFHCKRSIFLCSSACCK